MKISRKAEYALRALIHAAAYPPGTVFQIRELAQRNGIPKKFLELILLELKNKGILQSRRGVGGGYLLSRPPESIRATEIVEAIEGPVRPEGAKRKGAPSRGGPPGSHAVALLVREAGEAAAAALDRFSLADLAREEREAQERKARNMMYFI